MYFHLLHFLPFLHDVCLPLIFGHVRLCVYLCCRAHCYLSENAVSVCTSSVGYGPITLLLFIFCLGCNEGEVAMSSARVTPFTWALAAIHVICPCFPPCVLTLIMIVWASQLFIAWTKIWGWGEMPSKGFPLQSLESHPAPDTTVLEPFFFFFFLYQSAVWLRLLYIC